MSNDYNGKKRSELPDSVFGIPQERKYPMPDEKHTRSAIKLFNHVEPKYEEQLAKAIIKNMKKYNIDGSVIGPNNRLRKYLPKDMIKEYVEEACKDLIHARKLCNAVRKLARKYNANYFFVTDGASSYSNGNGKYNPAAKEMRDHMDDWERNNGFNPDDDWTDNINNVSNYRLLKESSIPEEIPKDIRELLRRLNSYDYGYIKNGQKIKGTKNFFEDYKSLTISEFEKYQIGVCWDYVHYEAYWFSKNKYKYETFYIQVQDEDNDCPSHTYLVFYLPNSSKVYYFESSWGKYQGIEAFDNINKLHDTIKERHIESARSKCDPKTYFRNKYDAKSSRWEHLSCGDFMVKVSNGKVQVNESVSSTVSKDHKQKGHIKLSSLKKVRITEYLIDKYKKEYPVLRHVRCKDTDEYVCDGYMWFKDDDLVCYVGSCQYTDDKTKWIVSLEILPKYRGYGLSNQILDFCVKSMNCKYLSVNKNNELAKKIYDKYGFKVYHEDKTMYYMTLDTISPKNESGGYIYSFERSPIQEYDYIPESGVLSVIKPIPTKDKNKIKYIMEDLGDDFKDFVFANICFYDIEECEKTPTGFVILRKKPELHTAFVSIGVLEQHRNSGVGSKLLQKAISYFKSTKDLMWLEYWVNIDNKASIALAEKSGFVEYLSGDTAKALGYYHYHMKNNNNLYEASISEYGTTGGTIVGNNQPDSVYIVNYMQNNAFSGHKEPKFGVCRKGMKDLHIVGGKYNRFHYVSDLDKFKEEASDIHVYRFKGKPKNEFFDIIEEMKDDNDLDLYKLITGREIKDRSEIRFDGDFIEEECFFDTIDAIKACTEAGLLEASTDLHPVPILTETVQGRQYNYYRDLNGVFIQHEITGLRSKSYETLDDIPEAEKDIVKRGYLV